ncbi:MAG: hypothetical protein ACI4JC_01345 [Faecalibacterium sp.]
MPGWKEKFLNLSVTNAGLLHIPLWKASLENAKDEQHPGRHKPHRPPGLFAQSSTREGRRTQMTQNNIEALLEQAARSSELPGWNDQLQWLVNATLSRFERECLLDDEDLFYVTAGTGIPDPKEENPKK